MGIETRVESSSAVLRLTLAVFAFIGNGALWESCSAEVITAELIGAENSGIENMKTHFCSVPETCANETEGICPSSVTSPPVNSICFNLCHCDNNDQAVCYSPTGSEQCREEDQGIHCIYADAIVCRYNDGSGSCVYSSSSSISPFCICKDENGSFPTPALQSDITESRKSGSSTMVPATSASSCESTSEAPSGITTSVTASLSLQSSSTPSGKQPMTINSQPTTMNSQPMTMNSQPTTMNSRPTTASSGQVNIIAIVLGVVLSLVVLGILVVICLCRRGKLSARKNSSTSRDDAPGVELGASGRPQVPASEVNHGVEYSFVYDHWPRRPNDPDTGEQAPANQSDANTNTGGSDRYVTNGPGCSTSANTVAALDHPYSEVQRQADGEEMDIEDGGGTEAAAGQGVASPGDSSREEGSHAYFQVYPTEETHASSGYEEVKAIDKAEDGTSSPYQQLNRATMRKVNEGAIGDTSKSHYEPLKGRADYDVLNFDGHKNANQKK